MKVQKRETRLNEPRVGRKKESINHKQIVVAWEVCER